MVRLLTLAFVLVTLLLGMIAGQPGCCTEKSLSGYVLRGATYKTYFGTSLERCTFYCEKDKQCASINYKWDAKRCQLNKVLSAYKRWRARIIANENSIFIKVQLHQYGCEWQCKNGGTYILDHSGMFGFCACTKGYMGVACEVCIGSALGLVSGYIKDSQMKSTSSRPGHEAYQARLTSRYSGWIPARTDTKQYLSIDFGNVAEFTFIITQGIYRLFGVKCWVSSYMLSYRRLDKPHLGMFYKGSAGKTKVFSGNINAVSSKTNVFHRHFMTNGIKIHPRTWWSCIALKLELYGCYVK